MERQKEDQSRMVRLVRSLRAKGNHPGKFSLFHKQIGVLKKGSDGTGQLAAGLVDRENRTDQDRF